MEIPKGYSLEPPKEELVSHWALYTMRKFVIDLKEPLRKAIEGARNLKELSKELFSAIEKIPLMAKGNTSFTNTHILINEREKIRQYHTNRGSRAKLVDNALTLDIFEYEHDGYYAFIQDMILIDLAIELAKGNWIPRFSKFPQEGNWAGPDLPDIEKIREQLREALNDVRPDTID